MLNQNYVCFESKLVNLLGRSVSLKIENKDYTFSMDLQRLADLELLTNLDSIGTKMKRYLMDYRSSPGYFQKCFG